MLTTGGCVVVCGIEDAPALALHLETFLSARPYLWVNGAWTEVTGTVMAIVRKPLPVPVPWTCTHPCTAEEVLRRSSEALAPSVGAISDAELGAVSAFFDILATPEMMPPRTRRTGACPTAYALTFACATLFYTALSASLTAMYVGSSLA